jgi:cytochrome c
MSLLRRAIIASGLLLFAAQAPAQPRPTPDEAKELTLKAAALIAAKGIVASRSTFHQEGDFRHGEIYVNVIDQEGHWLVYPPQPAGEGQSMLKVRDPDGKPIVQEIIRVAREQGEGWVEYRWANPVSKKIEPKVTYVKQVPGQPIIAYVGVYK